MSLMKKLMSNSKIKKTSILTESEVFTDKDVIQTDVPMINVALSGKLDGGLSPGLLVIAAESKHFKSSFALVLGSAFQKKYSDGIILFYDTEFGMPQQYFKQFGIDTNRVVHVPVTDVEELKHDIVNQLNNINRGEKVFIILDSLGNLASKKEVEDAIEGKSVADMSRAKQFKSLFRMVTPHLTLKDIPMVVINHVYKEIGTMFPKNIPGGGCVVAGTLIKTPNGTKSIETLKVGDSVISSDGISEITHIWNPSTLDEGTPFCYQIEFEDGSSVICSDNHLFLIDGKWVPAKSLVVGQNCYTI